MAAALRPGEVPESPAGSGAFHEWASRLWYRMDRDGNGFITADELDCDEFQDVLKTAITHASSGHSRATYARAELNVQQAVNFCMRKADLNDDSRLCFEEFESFLRALRSSGHARTADLVFALFDLDGDQAIDKGEFREIYRYFAGRHATAAELATEWELLDPGGAGRATKAQYLAWFRVSDNPIFRVHAQAAAAGGGDQDVNAAWGSAASSSSGLDVSGRGGRRGLPAACRRVPGLLPPLGAKTWSESWHPPWNARFNAKDNSQQNAVRPKYERQYFSDPKNVQQLAHFYQTYAGFEGWERRLARPRTPRLRGGPLSNSAPSLISGRDTPAGFARDRSGEPVPWTDAWVTPLSAKPGSYRPPTLYLRVPGPPPDHLRFGRDAPAKPR